MSDYAKFLSWIENDRKIKGLTMQELSLLYDYYRKQEDAGYLVYSEPYSADCELML